MIIQKLTDVNVTKNRDEFLITFHFTKGGVILKLKKGIGMAVLMANILEFRTLIKDNILEEFDEVYGNGYRS